MVLIPKWVDFLDAEIEKELTKERVKEFKNILLHYIDFQQKQKVGKYCCAEELNIVI